MNNEQTYYAVQIGYPAPAHMGSLAFGGIVPDVIDGRFFTRATTMAELYLDLRRFAIERRLEELNHNIGPDVDEIKDLTLAEIEVLVSPKIRKLVAITDPVVCEVISGVWDVIEQLELVRTAVYIFRATQRPMTVSNEASQHIHDLEASVKDLMKYHLVENPEPMQYLPELEKLVDMTHQFIHDLRNPVEPTH